MDILNLLQNDGDIIRMPFLVKGRLIMPPAVGREEIITAFSTADADDVYTTTHGAQIIREPVIERSTMKYTGGYRYQVMPPADAHDLIETDTDRAVRDLYALSVDDILNYVEAVSSYLDSGKEQVQQLRDVYRLTCEFPDAFLDHWFDSLPSALSRRKLEQMIDAELSYQGRRGRDFLDGWVDVAAQVEAGWLNLYAERLFAEDTVAGEAMEAGVRAMPTRQLHITAGNAPDVPLISILRAVLTKSAAVIKLPYGATLTGAMFSLAAAIAAPDHPITRNLSIVYWQGGDNSIESVLFSANAFDRIVVWGSPETVNSVRSRAPFTRVISFDPRYGVSLIGKEAFSGHLKEAALRASEDMMVYNQKACTASLVHYIEASEEQAHEYASILSEVLARWDEAMPNFVAPAALGRIKRMQRGKYISGGWYVNREGDDFCSGAVVLPGEFDLLDHPMCRLAVVRPVKDLDDALKYLNKHVSAAGVYPQSRRFQLRERMLAAGVSSVLPLGQCERIYAGMPHDGMRVLSELVDWKNG